MDSYVIEERKVIYNPAQTLIWDILDNIKKITISDTYEIEEKYVIEVKLNSLIQALYVLTTPFWNEMSITKDILSYRFNLRMFPESTTVLPIENKKPVELSNTRRQTILKKRAKYGVLNTGRLLEDVAYINEAGKFLYTPLLPNKYYEFLRQDQVEQLFYKLKDLKSKVNLFQALVCSREFCHLAFSTKVLDIFKEPNDKLYYHIFFGLYLLYKEECQMGTKVNIDSRHLLDLEAVAKIPPFKGKITHNPFIPLTLTNDQLESKKISSEVLTVKPIKGMKHRGLYSIYSSWKRFDIFTEGLFKGLNCDKIYFGGSMVMACLIRSPLEKLFDINIPREEDLLFDEVLPADDISYSNYMARLKKLYMKWDFIEDNVNDYFDEYFPSKNVLPKFKVGKDITNLQFLDLEDNLSDIDIKVDVVSDVDFDNITTVIFNTVKENLGRKHSFNKIDKHVQLIKVLTNKSYKYYISGTILKRSIEIYRFYMFNPFGGVSRFHFPTVRALFCPRTTLKIKKYDELLFGKIYVFPSFWSYAQTGFSIDYRWLAHGSHPIELILKYYMRGAVPILNENEHKAIYDHIKNNNKWSFLLKYRDQGEYNSINNPIFKPRKYLLAHYTEIRKYLEPLSRDAEYCYIPNEDEVETPINDLRWPSGHLKANFN